MPKVVNHKDRRENVAEATWRVIAKRGVDTATIREIAKEANCATGMLQYYFKNKDELILYALQLAVLRMGGRMWRRGEESAGTQILRNVIIESLPLDEERRLEWQILAVFYGRAATNTAMAEECDLWYTDYRILLRGLITNGKRDGYYRTEIDAATEADAIISLVVGVGVLTTIKPRHFAPEFQLELLDRHLSRLLC
ncbi:MAG: TetR family transcriptional regulator C-terminal domain-containing protein [Candidatus Lindowbacteria bacterium]|nr:TetR family transcriptional regulator C-terminal domain-containing protein [Candidatus Lindowbacteria bacterium]